MTARWGQPFHTLCSTFMQPLLVRCCSSWIKLPSAKLPRLVHGGTQSSGQNIFPSRRLQKYTMSHSSSALAIEQVPEERVSYTWHDGVEHLETYQAGGYHPVHLQEVYKDDRYCVVHKLGYGSFSTVWLARDQHKNQYVALKILIAERSQAASESRILRYLQDVQQKCGTRSYVIPLLDEFYIDGPNGRHLCLVNEIARCSIRDSNPSSNKWNFPLVVARAIAAQAVLGLKEIHSSGVVHGGK